jgi:hypothetical protein
MSAGAFEIVAARVPQGLGVLVRSHAAGTLFRITPVRDPDQPRFWCLRIDRCLRTGFVDPAAPSCLTEGGLTRDSLMEVLAAIRGDVNGWLSHAGRQALRRWLGDQLAEESASAPAQQRESRSRGLPRRAQTGPTDPAIDHLIPPLTHAETCSS